MKTYRTPDGFIIKMMNEDEQAKAWKELSVDISPIGKNIELFTPRDNKGYFIVSEKEISFEKYEAVIKANGKTIKVKYNICNQDEKTYKAVRQAYGMGK